MKQKRLGRWIVAIAATVAILSVGVVDYGLAQSDGETEYQYEDTFDTLDPAWGVADDTKFIQDGVLVIKPAPGYSTWPQNQGMLFDDADVSVRLRQVGGSNASQANGLVFWGNSYSDFYIFGISADGSLVVLRVLGEKWLTPVPWRPNDAIKKGLDEWNELRVKTGGNQATLYINGAEIVTFRGQPKGSFVGLFASSPNEESCTYEFDDLRVR